MTDSTRPHIDRYVRRELTPAEARELAQQSLADPELFEDLTASALAVAAVGASSSKVVRFPKKSRILVAAAVAAAIVVSISVYSLKQSQPRQTGASLHLKPTLSATSGQPILLASGLQAEPNSTPIFRSVEPNSRAPRPIGSIVAIDDGVATIDLGSLDGLTKGSEVQVFRDDNAIGILTVNAVFRERARGRIPAGTRVNDQVSTTASAYLDALLQQVEALSGRVEADSARKMVEKASAWADSSNVVPVELERLAKLEYQSGLLQAAERHYERLNGESSDALNNLAVLRMLRGDYDGAEAPLNRVVSTSPKTDLAYARSLNNLAVLAELRGDSRKAERLYTDALRAGSSPPPERQALETNLARIRGAR